MTEFFQAPRPHNEPVLDYAPGSRERKDLKAGLAELKGRVIDIPLIIGGREIRTGKTDEVRIPHEHRHILARCHKAGHAEAALAIEEAKKASAAWRRMPWRERAGVFLKAAGLLSGAWRRTLNAATMLGQSKNPHEAEADTCELADLCRFNVFYAGRLYGQQPDPARGASNYMDYRPLEGFVFAVTPFNFTCIAGNLPAAPALMGNTVVWKPASTAVYSGYFLMKLWQAAGLPDGVINMVPGSAADVANPVLDRPDFAGLHFTGSTPVFNTMWSAIARNLHKYANYPRLVGETGGKGFIFAHASADAEALKTSFVRGSFEYQGQKCSAASRAYIPASLWDKIRDELADTVKAVKIGPCEDFTNFMNAVIDKAAYDNIRSFINLARNSASARIIAGGACRDAEGYFIEPTLIETSDPEFRTMQEEIFGPVMTVYVYEDARFEETLRLCDATSPYALTGSVFAQDRAAALKAADILEYAAGNFYINDKPTGAVTGQQPFGGGRLSGTNDKAGSVLNLSRWTSPRVIKENFSPPTDYEYPFMRKK